MGSLLQESGCPERRGTLALPRFFARNPLAREAKWGPFLLGTDESLLPDTMVLLPGCLIVSSSDAMSMPMTTRVVVDGQSMLRLTSFTLPPDMESVLKDLLSTAPMDLV